MRARSAGKVEELKRELILSAEEDYIDLSAIAYEVESTLKVRGKDAIRNETIRILAELLEDGYIRAGIPTAGGGFNEWDENLVEVVAHIDGEWRRLGRTPELGEIVWFEATDKGVSYVGAVTAAN
jgi:hypothetical protein